MKPKLERTETPVPVPAALPVFEYKGKLVADCRKIAPLVEKDHAHLVQDIRQYVKVIEKARNPNSVSAEYFIPTTCISPDDRLIPNFFCTEKGCAMIADSLTGDRWSFFTILFEKAFYDMREQLRAAAVWRGYEKPGENEGLYSGNCGQGAYLSGQAVEPDMDLQRLRTAGSIVLPPQQANGEPYTTSEIIAEGTGINHKRVRDAICKYKTDLETFGILTSYQAQNTNAISTPYQAEISFDVLAPGQAKISTQKEGSGRPATGYILNEQQATFLMTLLKNTSIVVAFKRELVRQFYEMRERLRNGSVWEEYEEPEEDEELYSENCGLGAYLAGRKVTEAQMLAARRASERRMERHKARLRELLDHL